MVVVVVFSHVVVLVVLAAWVYRVCFFLAVHLFHLHELVWAQCAHVQHFPPVVLVVVVPLGLWLGKNGIERGLMIGSWCLVMVVELLNSAIEALVDRSGLDRNELAGRAKDLGSAAVFSAIVLAIVVWAFILLTR